MRQTEQTPGYDLSYPFQAAPTTNPLGPDTGPMPPRMPRKRKLAPILIVGGAVLVSAMIVLVVASLNLGAFSSSALFKNTTSAQAPVAALNTIVGHVRFSSSGQINESTSQGIADEVELDLSNIPQSFGR